jgi:hypothetical protein
LREQKEGADEVGTAGLCPSSDQRVAGRE